MKKKLKKNRIFGLQNEGEPDSLQFLINYEEEIINVLNGPTNPDKIWMNAESAKWLGNRLLKAAKSLESKK